MKKKKPRNMDLPLVCDNPKGRQSYPGAIESCPHCGKILGRAAETIG